MKNLTKTFIILASAFSILNASADSETVRKKHYNLKSSVAIQGYDPVSYIDSKQATKGKSIYPFTYKGVKYRFASKTNLNKFKANPAKYEPAYGGWCAYALAEGNGKVGINPKRFKVVGGKLYLFYDKFPGGNTLKKWNQGSDAEQIKKADAEWKKII